MGQKRKYQISNEIKDKRKKRRARIKASGKNPDEFFSAGIYIGPKG